MKIELLQENLAKALKQLQRVIPNKPQLPILSSVLFSVKEKRITLAATDLYVGMTTTVPGKVEKDGSIAIPGKIFHDSITSLNPGKITLTLEENTLTIVSDNNTTTIQCLPPDEFPSFPEIKGVNHTLKQENVQQIQEMVSFSTSLDPTRPVLTALLFSFSTNDLLVVGTDGFRLATLQLSAEQTKEDHQFLIPAKALSEVTRISTQLEQEEVNFTVSEELKQVLFSLEETNIYVRLIEGEYPPFSKIIPTDYKTELVFTGEELENQLKRAQVFARESSNIIRFQIKGSQVTIIASSPAYGSQEGVISVEKVSGDDGEIAFNSRYLLDFLSTVKPEKITFKMNESLTPALFKPEGMDNYQYIVMPFRVNE